jgi:clan AA aspartic protease (TIGR02281 family)
MGADGVTKDYKEAAKWYKLAAAQGDTDAQDTLGAIFYNGGNGVTQDYKEAAKWYRLAADKGNADAQLQFGYMSYYGQGVTRDYREAAKWYRLAATQGNADAQFFLGLMYNEGKGVAKDYQEATKWYRLAAQQGLAKAQLVLGVQYNGGREGVAQDYLYSYMWFSIVSSKEGGALSEIATRQRDNVEKEMTREQVLAAQEMAKRCEQSNYKQCDKLGGNQDGSSATSVPMRRESGTYVVSVVINDAITLNFIVDSGATDVSIPADVVMTLKRTGTLRDADFQGEQRYKLADGSTVPSQTFRIRSLKIGGKIVENVTGSIGSEKSSPLLGQSFLSHFKSWSVDNTKHVLVLE